MFDPDDFAYAPPQPEDEAGIRSYLDIPTVDEISASLGPAASIEEAIERRGRIEAGLHVRSHVNREMGQL
jgi:hypothetical protein